MEAVQEMINKLNDEIYLKQEIVKYLVGQIDAKVSSNGHALPPRHEPEALVQLGSVMKYPEKMPMRELLLLTLRDQGPLTGDDLFHVLDKVKHLMLFRAYNEKGFTRETMYSALNGLKAAKKIINVPQEGGRCIWKIRKWKV